ncbi:WhiB family transcriptional regulator [Corynebacterium falsenii]
MKRIRGIRPKRISAFLEEIMTASLARPTATTSVGAQPTRMPAKQLTHRDSFRNRGEWITEAHCRNVDPDELFVKGAEQRKAVAICRHCPVVLQCRADALDNKVEFGVWGGMTERQRRALLRKHPEIDSWADFFAGQLEAVANTRD